MKQKKYIVTILLDKWEAPINLTTNGLDLVRLHCLLDSLEEIGEIQEVTEYETD